MDFKALFPKIIPYAAAVILFILISFAYFPEVLDGKKLTGHDNATWAGMSKELMDYREETGEEALWTNSMFGGMPAYLISTKFPGNTLRAIYSFLQLGPRPVSFLFLYMIGFYILLLAFGVNPWLAIPGAIAFCFSSFNFVIIAAGHNSQAIAIGFVPPMLAGIILTFRGMRILGPAVTALFLSIEILAGHPQITYYSIILVFIFGLVHLYFSIREKYLKDLIFSVSLLIIALVFGVLTNTGRLWTTMEYGKYSMRSKSELSGREEDKTSGLTKSYATQWSYGIDETMTLLIPNFKGGSNDGSVGENSETYRLFAQNNPAQAREIIKHLPLYWGTQPGTMGPYSVGAIMVFLFVLGMFVVDKKLKWWLLSATLLSIMLSWGKNFMAFTEFFMENVPGYNKFRTVTMALSITQVTMPLMAMLALRKVLFGEIPKKQFSTAMKWSLGIVGGVSLLFALFPDAAGDFTSFRDSQYQDVVAKAFQADRRMLLRTDAFRSLVFILLSAGAIQLFRMKKLKVNLTILIIGVLVIGDMWPVNKRYLNKDHFSNKREAEQVFTPTAADQFILNDPSPGYRVLNLTQSVFQESNTSYFHHSIGGYHGAKMRRYQDLIDNRFDAELTRIIDGLQSQNSDSIVSALQSANALNMLNMKYIIINPQGQPVVNPAAMGSAWTVSNYRIVNDADEEMALLGTFDVRQTVLVDRRFAEYVEGKTFPEDPTARISLAEYQPNRLVYAYEAGQPQIGVFSEIYYEKGWKASIDGEPADHFRVNYTLRGMALPEGKHEIVFEFHPESYYAGTRISMISSIILILLLAGAIFLQFKYPEKGKGKDLISSS